MENKTTKIEHQLLYNLSANLGGYKSLEKCTAALFADVMERRVFCEIAKMVEDPDFNGNNCPAALFEDDEVFDYFAEYIEPNATKDDTNTNNAVYIRRLKDARLRDLEIKRCEALIAIAKDGDKGYEAKEAAEAEYEAAVAELMADDEPIESASTLVDGYLEYLSYRRKYLPTQFGKLNDVIYGGFVGGQLICVGARPSRGKTEILNQFAEYQSTKGHHVLYFSLEMNKYEMLSRMVLSDGSVDHRELQAFNRDSVSREFLQRITAIAGNTYYHPIDNVRSAAGIIAKIRQCHKRGVSDIVYIDYLGLCTSENANLKQRYREIAEMTHAFKGLAQSLNIPIVIAHQLNREAGDEHIPNMSNLRESGDIEQDADIVMLIQSPSFCPEAGEIWDDHIRLVLAKHRNGERGVFHLKHNGAMKALTDETDEIMLQTLKNEFI